MIGASMTIAVCLLGGALAAAFIAGLRSLRRRRYQGPASEPYAGFQSGAHTGTGEFLQLECQGHCPGSTAHEVDGDGGATCVLCGATRSATPAPHEA
ncbi:MULTISPECIES: hypothetical protein [Actinomycetes]|uniref:hypothetical protein n=1 Tax=Actinomycetes TaxID=1760 RepID=UPI000A3BC125|nr:MULTISPECIES: hypothetical protein [Actinomycetes]